MIPAPAEAHPSLTDPRGSDEPELNYRDGQWVQPECTEPSLQRGPMRLFLERVEAAQAPRSAEQSWLYRPLHAGVFFGALFGTDLVSDWVSEKSGFFGGVRAGWDFDPYWGIEARYAMGNVQISDSERAIAERDYWHEQIPSWYYNEHARYSARNVLDVSMLYYLRGDVRLRPYILFGVGYASLRFDDALGEHWSHSTIDMPLAIGLKYLWSDQMAVRLEANDTIIIGNSKIETVHDMSLNIGLEVRFGGSRRSYWPWNPGDRYW